jgi:SAM-dependent methyltransferase
VDPEPDMLIRARRAAGEQGVTNVSWMVGADTDMPTLGMLLGNRTLGAVIIGQALHWMHPDKVFRALVPFLRPGGGVAVVTNGTPLWLQDTAWSRALRDCLEHWLGHKLTRTCGTDGVSQRRYRDSLAAAGYDVRVTSVDYTDEIDLEQIIGGIYSALSVDQLPEPGQRPHFADRIRRALQLHLPFTEQIHVAMLIGRHQ